MRVKLIIVVLLIVVTATKTKASYEDDKKLTPDKTTAVNSQAALPISYQIELIKAINEVKAKDNFSSNNFIITKTTQSNGSRLALQVEDFLLSRGIKIQAYGTKSMQLKGFAVIKNETCFEIIIGVL